MTENETAKVAVDVAYHIYKKTIQTSPLPKNSKTRQQKVTLTIFNLFLRHCAFA